MKISVNLNKMDEFEKTNNIMISLRISKKQHDLLKRHAGPNMSRVIRYLIQEFVETMEKEKRK